jgi:RimJ/RimL family protein N-acetyltransferase
LYTKALPESNKDVRAVALSLQRSVLDSTRFGLEVFIAGGLTCEEVPELAARVRAQACDLVITRIDANELRLLHALEACGFRVMDTVVRLGRDVDARDKELEASGTRAFTAADITSIANIAARAFRGYLGHYHNDDRLPRAACDELYRDWAARACREKSVADAVIVSTPAEIVLCAMDPARQGAGLWPHLIRGAIRWAQAAGATHISAATHITNLRSQRGFMRAGFTPRSHAYTLHWWPTR